MNPDRARWNEKYRAGRTHVEPSVRLMMHQGRLAKGRALDLAGGSGENATILAMAGWQVTVADISDEALAHAGQRAGELKADIHRVQGDALRLPFRGPFETIIVTKFLERTIVSELVGLLAPGGTIFCETLRPRPGQALGKGLPEPYGIKAGEYATLFGDLEAVLDTADDASAVFIGRKSTTK